MRALMVLVLVLVSSTPSQATTFAPIPFEQAVSEAPMIVRGEVTLVRSDWGQSEDGARRIYTFIDLRVVEWLKGRPADFGGNQLTVREIGGVAGDVGMEVAGSAKFRSGEEVVLLVMDRRQSDGSYDLRGLMMSKLSVRRDAGGEEVLAGPAIGMGRNDPHGDQNGTDEGRRSWSIREFKELLAAQGTPAQAGVKTGNSADSATLSTGDAAGTAAGAPALQPASPESGVGPEGATSGQDAGAETQAGKPGDEEVPSDFPGTWFAFTLALGVAVLIVALVAWIRHRSMLRNRPF